MSSMLKKTGGLTFKPKVGRRPGAGAASRPPTNTTSSTPTTRAPTTEPTSQTTTPAASAPSTSAVVDSIRATIHTPNEAPSSTETPTTPATLQTPSASEPHTATPAVQPTSASKSTASPTSVPEVRNPTPHPTPEATHGAAPRLESTRSATDISNRHLQPALSVETENSPQSTINTSAEPSTPTTTTTSESPTPEQEIPGRPPTTSSSLPPAPPTPVASAPGEATTASQPPTPNKQPTRRHRSTATDATTNAESSAPKKKRQRTKSSTLTTAEAGKAATTEAPRPARRRKRGLTPENAEELTVDHSTMTVGELTKDLGIGKRFRHAEEIEQRAREARAKNRLRKLEREQRRLGLLPPEHDGLASQANAPHENEVSRGAAMAQVGASIESGAAQGVGYDVVDGQIVVHAASLVVDRHNHDMSGLEEVEENDFTNLVNSASFAKRVQAPGNWTDEETEKFYRLLGMFGTDFETISRLFPGKNRRAVKLKFNKEERLRPNRVNAAMMVRGQKKVNIDIEEYKASQRQWQAKDKILEEHRRLVEEHERDVARLREERRAAGLIDDEEAQGAKRTDNDGNTQGNGEFEVIEEDAEALSQNAQSLDGDMDVQPEDVGVQA